MRRLFSLSKSPEDGLQGIDAIPVPMHGGSISRRVTEILRPWSSIALKNMIPEEKLAQNPLMIQFYTWDIRGTEEISWWKKFENETGHLEELGVTHVWLPPPNRAEFNDGVGYAAYDLWDIGEFHQKGAVATRWGTKEEFERAIKAARSHGIEVLIDAVLGHRLGGDKTEVFEAIPVEANNRLRPKGPPRDIKAHTSFEFPGRGDSYSKFKWNHAHFTGIDRDINTESTDIHYIPDKTRKGWSRYVSDELGNYDYLLGCDVDHNHPDVKEDLLRWGSWILQTTGAGGFRLDAIKHMDRRFLFDFLDSTNNSLGRNVFAVSECWTHDVKVVETYLRALKDKSTLFDVPLHYNLHNASKVVAEGSGDIDLRKIFKNSLVEKHPLGAVTFVDNHDTQIGQTLESWVYKEFKVQAYTMILFRGRGLPCVFFGDLYPCPDSECYDPDTAKKLLELLRVRKLYAHGPTVDYLSYRNCVGFVRTGSRELKRPGCAVVIRSGSGVDKDLGSSGKREGTRSTTSEYSTSIRMRVEQKPAVYRDVLGDESTVSVSSDGWGVFPCPPGAVSVWVAEESIHE